MGDWQRVLLAPAASLQEAMECIDRGTLRVALVVDPDRKLLGTVVDGDIRRALLKRRPWETPVSEVMFRKPSTAQANTPRDELLEVMRQRNIDHIPVVDSEGHVIGLETLHGLVDRPRYDNWVFLLAGGLGSRLRPHTEETPKPMLEVGKQPILEKTLERMTAAGFRRFFLSVRYRADIVREHFGDGSRWGVEITYVDEDRPLGTAGALGLLTERPEAPLLVMNGDILTTVNYEQLLDYHRATRGAATMCVREYDFQVPFGTVETEHERVVRVVEKPLNRFLINAGIYVLEPVVLDRIESGVPLDMPDLLNTLIDTDAEVSVFPLHEYWIDIGRADDLERARTDDGNAIDPALP